MTDLNTSLQWSQRNGSALGQVAREVNHRGLQLHKDAIITLYNSPGIRMKDLPQLAEARLGIKASLKQYRIALNRWDQKRYVPREHKLLMIGILKKWERQGRSVEFRLHGQPYSRAKLQRFIADEQKAKRLDDKYWATVTSYSARDIPEEVFYSDPNDRSANLLAMDGCSRQAGQQQNNVPISGDHTTIIQDRISWTTQILAPMSPFRRSDDHNPICAYDEVIPSASILTVEEPNGAATASLQFIWQLVVVAGNFPEYTSEASDMHNHRLRALNLYRECFGNTPYDPSCMGNIFLRFLEDDRLQEAEELALLAADLSECWLGPDHVEAWKAKGNLAHVYHEQGRYHIAHQLGADIVELFKCNGDEFDENAHIFKTNLADTLLMLGEIAEAKDLCYDVVGSASLFYGEEHNITLTAKFQLAKVCNALCDYHEARELLTEVTFARKRQQEQGILTAKTLRAYIEFGETLQQLGLETESIEIQWQIEKKLQGSGMTRSMWTLELVWSIGKLLYSLGHYMGAEQVFRNLVEYMPTRTKSRNHPKVVFANCWLAKSLYCQDKCERATEINEECVRILSEVFGPLNRHTLSCMSNLAWSRKNSLALPEFEAKMVEVRDIRKLRLGENDPDTLDSERFCAGIMWKRGDWNDAQDLLGQLRAKLKSLPEIRRSYVELELMSYEAGFYFARGQYRKAAKVQRNQMILGESIFGKEHRLATVPRDSLAMTLSKMGQYHNAMQLLCKGILRLSGSLGRNHPAVTQLKISQAAVLARQNQWASAGVLQRQILQEWEIYGEKHPYVIQATTHLARSYTELGKYSEAGDLFKRAMKASKSVFGPIHLEVIKVLNGYAMLMRTQRKWQDARDLYEESWNMSRKSLGSPDGGVTQELPLALEHPDIINASERLANVLDKTGDLSRSLFLRKQILSVRIKLLGSLHPHTICAISNLACTQMHLGNTREALRLRRDSSAKYRKVLGRWHPDSLQDLLMIGDVLRQLKMFVECKVHYNDLLGALRATRGENNLDTARVMWRIARLHFDQNQYTQAEGQFQHALGIFENIGASLGETLDVMVELAQCYRMTGQYERAEVQTKAAIEKGQGFLENDDPLLTIAHSHLAWTYLEAGKYCEAEILAQTLLQGSDQDVRADIKTRLGLEGLLACSLAGQRKFTDAITFLEDAISQRRNKNPEDPTALELKKVLSRIETEMWNSQENGDGDGDGDREWRMEID